MNLKTSFFQFLLLSIIVILTSLILLHVRDISKHIITSPKELQKEALMETHSSATLVKAEEKESRGDLKSTTKDPFEVALSQRIIELKSQSEVERPTQSAKNLAFKTETSLADKSCYVTIGNYSQPKFAYDAECNLLSNEKHKKKISLTLNKLPDYMTANFSAENEKGVIFVFTDYTCPYCRRLHESVDEFNAKGYTVKYLQYPRILNAAPNSEQARVVMANMENAWCAPDHRTSFKTLYSTGKIDEYECQEVKQRIKAPLREHFALGKQIDLKYTPTVVSQDGEVSYGFNSVSRTLRELGL